MLESEQIYIGEKGDRPILISQTTLLKDGFTQKLIKDLLPPPILKENPISRHFKPMKLWQEEDVLKAKQTPKYKQRQVGKEARKASAQKAVETKKEKLRIEIDKKIKQIKIRKISQQGLRDNTLRAKENWYLETDQWENNVYLAGEETVKRWMVNYVRHEMTDYDYDLYTSSGKTGCREEYFRCKNAVLDKIAEIYPFLKEECERQKITYEEWLRQQAEIEAQIASWRHS